MDAAELISIFFFFPLYLVEKNTMKKTAFQGRRVFLTNYNDRHIEM